MNTVVSMMALLGGVSPEPTSGKVPPPCYRPMGLATTAVFLRGFWGCSLAWLMLLLAGTFDCQGIAAAQVSPPSDRLTGHSRCLSRAVPLHRSWEQESDVDINREFNDYAGIYLDSVSAECKQIAAKALIEKLEGTLDFADAGGTVMSPPGMVVHPFHNWLWGAAMTHMFAAAMELRYNGVSFPESALLRARDAFATIPDNQDPGCAVPTNGCMDDYGLTASGFAWIAAYEARVGRDPHVYIERARWLLTKMFEPMSVSGSVCYYVVGSNPARCDGDPAGIASGKVRIIGVGHGMENPNYGLGLMTAVASSSLALFLAGFPVDFTTTDPTTNLAWREIAIELLRHAKSKICIGTASFAANCLDLSNPAGPAQACGDVFGYSADLYSLRKFYVTKLGYPSEDSRAVEFGFDSFDPNYEWRQPETMLDRNAFWGLNRFVFYNLFANEAWPGGTLNAHFRQMTLIPWPERGVRVSP